MYEGSSDTKMSAESRTRRQRMQRRLDKTDECQGNGLRYNKHEEKITGESNIEKPSATKRGCNEMPSRKRDRYA